MVIRSPGLLVVLPGWYFTHSPSGLTEGLREGCLAHAGFVDAVHPLLHRDEERASGRAVADAGRPHKRGLCAGGVCGRPAALLWIEGQNGARAVGSVLKD